MAMTLRLNEEEEEQALNEIKEMLGCNTASAALKKVIKDYQPLTKRLADETHRAKQATDELRELKRTVNDYFKA